MGSYGGEDGSDGVGDGGGGDGGDGDGVGSYTVGPYWQWVVLVEAITPAINWGSKVS